MTSAPHAIEALASSPCRRASVRISSLRSRTARERKGRIGALRADCLVLGPALAERTEATECGERAPTRRGHLPQRGRRTKEFIELRHPAAGSGRARPPARLGSWRNGFHRPVLKHGPRSLTYMRVFGWQTRVRNESEGCRRAAEVRLLSSVGGAASTDRSACGRFE
jgi:hypothetical protein